MTLFKRILAKKKVENLKEDIPDSIFIWPFIPICLGILESVNTSEYLEDIHQGSIVIVPKTQRIKYKI